MKAILTHLVVFSAMTLPFGCSSEPPKAAPTTRSVSLILKDARSATAKEQPTHALIKELESIGESALPQLKQERVTAKTAYDKALNAFMVNSHPYFEVKRVDANLYLAFIDQAIKAVRD